MLLSITQVDNIVVKNGEREFAFIKRKFGLKIISEFYQNKDLIFESSLYTIFLKQIVDIRFQNLQHNVSIERTGGWLYSLTYEQTVLSFKIRYFKRPAFILYKDGKQIGTIGNPKLVSLESRFYIMKTDTDDEITNLYFLILFLAQLRTF